MKLIDKTLLDETSAKAKQSSRLRMNYNFHSSLDAPVNRLLNAMEPGTYVRPHRHLHPPKDETFLLLRGKAMLILFDDNGSITDQILLSPDTGTYGAELEAGIWHSLIVLEAETVLYEVKEGPFSPLTMTDMAPWSPEINDTIAVKKYLNDLKTKALQRK